MKSCSTPLELKSKTLKKNQFFETLKNLNYSLEHFEELYFLRMQENAKKKAFLSPPLDSKSQLAYKKASPPINLHSKESKESVEEKIQMNIKKMEELQAQMEFITHEILDLNKGPKKIKLKP